MAIITITFWYLKSMDQAIQIEQNYHQELRGNINESNEQNENESNEISKQTSNKSKSKSRSKLNLSEIIILC